MLKRLLRNIPDGVHCRFLPAIRRAGIAACRRADIARSTMVAPSDAARAAFSHRR